MATPKFLMAGALALTLLADPLAAQEEVPLADRFHPTATHSVNELRPIWSAQGIRAYDRAMARFPDLAACLRADDPGAAPVFNWRAMRSEEAVELCLFLKAETLDGPEALVTWLEGQGFRAQVLSNVFPAGTRLVDAGFAGDHADAPVFRGWNFLFARWFADGFSIGIRFDAADRPVSVNLTFNYL